MFDVRARLTCFKKPTINTAGAKRIERQSLTSNLVLRRPRRSRRRRRRKKNKTRRLLKMLKTRRTCSTLLLETSKSLCKRWIGPSGQFKHLCLSILTMSSMVRCCSNSECSGPKLRQPRPLSERPRLLLFWSCFTRTEQNRKKKKSVSSKFYPFLNVFTACAINVSFSTVSKEANDLMRSVGILASNAGPTAPLRNACSPPTLCIHAARLFFVF